jgi:hypothetical protein
MKSWDQRHCLVVTQAIYLLAVLSSTDSERLLQYVYFDGSPSTILDSHPKFLAYSAPLEPSQFQREFEHHGFQRDCQPSY